MALLKFARLTRYLSVSTHILVLPIEDITTATRMALFLIIYICVLLYLWNRDFMIFYTIFAIFSNSKMTSLYQKSTDWTKSKVKLVLTKKEQQSHTHTHTCAIQSLLSCFNLWWTRQLQTLVPIHRPPPHYSTQTSVSSSISGGWSWRRHPTGA